MYLISPCLARSASSGPCYPPPPAHSRPLLSSAYKSIRFTFAIGYYLYVPYTLLQPKLEVLYICERHNIYCVDVRVRIHKISLHLLCCIDQLVKWSQCLSFVKFIFAGKTRFFFFCTFIDCCIDWLVKWNRFFVRKINLSLKNVFFLFGPNYKNINSCVKENHKLWISNDIWSCINRGLG